MQLAICYPQYWLMDTCDATFPEHMPKLKNRDETSKRIDVRVHLDAHTEAYKNEDG